MNRTKAPVISARPRKQQAGTPRRAAYKPHYQADDRKQNKGASYIISLQSEKGKIEVTCSNIEGRAGNGGRPFRQTVPTAANTPSVSARPPPQPRRRGPPARDRFDFRFACPAGHKTPFREKPCFCHIQYIIYTAKKASGKIFRSFLKKHLTSTFSCGIIIGRHHGTAMMREVATFSWVFPRSMSGGCRVKPGRSSQSGGWDFHLT